MILRIILILNFKFKTRFVLIDTEKKAMGVNSCRREEKKQAKYHCERRLSLFEFSLIYVHSCFNHTYQQPLINI